MQTLRDSLNSLMERTRDLYECKTLADYRYQFYCCKAALVVAFLERLANIENLDSLPDTLIRMGFLSPDVSKALFAGNRIITDAMDLLGDNYEPADFYQALLAFDLRSRGESFEVARVKTQRDATASYYTPPTLAINMVDKIINEIGEINPHSDKWVDFSCGAGDFLLVSFNQLRQAGIGSMDALGMLWGYDIDPTALAIAVFRLLSAAEIKLTPSIESLVSSHFHFGNPLLGAPRVAAVNKYRLYAEGLFYDSRMGLEDLCYPSKGFQVVMGNPPWEKIRFEERKFFQLTNPSIGDVTSKASRLQLINDARENDRLHVIDLYDALSDAYSKARLNIVDTYLKGVRGELNTYTLFANLALARLSESGLIALILKSAFFTAPNNGPLFSKLLSNGNILSAHLFSNAKKIFSIDQRERFAIAYFAKAGRAGSMLVSFGNEDDSFINSKQRLVTLDELSQMNPSTKTLPDMESFEMYDFVSRLHKEHRVFSDVYPDAHFGRLVHLTMHSEHIHKTPGDNRLPIFEGKFLGHHDLRYSTFEGMDVDKIYAAKASSRIMSEEEKAVYHATSRFYIDADFWAKISNRYTNSLMLCWRSLTSPTNSRTTIAALSPFVPASQSVQFLQLDDIVSLAILAGLFNSKPFDFLVRQKLPGIDLTQKIIEQIPVPAKSTYMQPAKSLQSAKSLEKEICTRVLSLYSNEPLLLEELRALPSIKHYRGDRNSALRELDLLFYQAYGLSEADVSLVENSFAQ